MGGDVAMSDDSAGDRKSDDGQPARKRPRLSSPSPPSVNSLLLDHPFLNTFISNVTDTSAPSILSIVFSTVYKNPAWSGKLKEEFKDLVYCEGAIKKDTSLLDCMKECAEKANWDPLFAHPALQAPYLGGFPGSQSQHVIDAFRSDYLGDGHKAMLKAIDGMKKRSLHASLLPVVQSSGTGKSKTIYRIAQDRIVIPMCLRGDDAEGYFSYPYPDKDVRKHFLAAPTIFKSMEAECKAYLQGFLRSLFHHTRKQLEEFGAKSYTDLAGDFLRFFDDEEKRKTFYRKVISSPLSSFCDENDTLEEWEALEDSLKRTCSESSLPTGYAVIIAMDDVRDLYDLRLHDKLSLYSCLKLVSSDLDKMNFCIVTLTTGTRPLPKRPPRTVVSPSMQMYHFDPYLIAPYTEHPFDAHIIANPLVSGQLGLGSVGTLEFTARFGRPLWYALHISRIKDDPSVPYNTEDIVRLVQQKLCCLQYPFKPFIQLDGPSIATLSSRLLLDLSPATPRAQLFDQELVRSHLRVAYSVHDDQDIYLTGSSPEPLLAEAAAQIMNIGGHMDVWGLLMSFYDTCMAVQGTVGEAIGRTLSILAMDSAIIGLGEHCELKYQTPVPVNAYYRALLTDDAWDALRTSVPVNGTKITVDSGTKTFEVAFKDAYFHFSHYGKANDTSRWKDSGWEHWLRGTAVSCQLHRDLPDRGLPIFFSDRKTVSAESVSWALEQDETSVKADPASVRIHSAESLGLFGGSTTLPYIYTVHCYSVLEDERIVTALDSLSIDAGSLPTKNEECPRYEIDIYGLASYRQLTGESKETVRAMINGPKPDKHPRQYGVPVLHQMQPMLTRDPINNAWHD